MRESLTTAVQRKLLSNGPSLIIEPCVVSIVAGKGDAIKKRA